MATTTKEDMLQFVDEYKMSQDKKSVVLFGAGKIGHTALSYCREKEIAVSCIIDNNSELWGRKVNGVEICPPDVLNALPPTLIILASSRTREMASQLEELGHYKYVAYYFFCQRYGAESVSDSKATSVERACNWIVQNQQENGGVSVFSGSPYEYPEVTGYIVPTMLQYGFRDEALAMVQYLASVANPDGSFTAADSDRVYLFDTAQALRGLNAIRKVTDQYSGLQEKTAEYLFLKLKEGDGLFPESYWDDPPIPEGIMLFALPPMLEYAQGKEDTKKIELVHQAVQAYLKRPDTLSMATLTHFLAYQIDGLIDLGYANEVKDVVQKLLASQREDGSIPAWEGVEWTCITGCSQIAICLYKLGMPGPANKLVAWAERQMEDDGGFLGSTGPGAEYFWDRELSWAVKFYLDAYKQMISAHFDFEFAPVAPTEIPVDDDEVTSITDQLQGSEHVLEVGCGKGRILKRIHERFPECRLEGMDISKGMLSCVPDFVKTSVGDMEFLPYENDRFDLVYTVECIEHSVNLRAAVRELVRVCKPGGKIVIIDKQMTHWGRLATPPWERWPDRVNLENLLEEECASVRSQPVHPWGADDWDDMFIKWEGVK